MARGYSVVLKNKQVHNFDTIQDLRRWAYFNVKPKDTDRGKLEIFRNDNCSHYGYIMKDREGILTVFVDRFMKVYIFDHKGGVSPAPTDFGTTVRIITKSYQK